MREPDTIVALASGAGRAGVAVLRVSGPRAADICVALTDGPPPAERMAELRVLRDPRSGEVLDEAIVISFVAPRSYTGEHTLELHTHGGPAIVRSVLDAVTADDVARLAEPGEFTRRAFENGRLDLTQAEAIADLIDAETDNQRRQALRVYGGEAARRFDAWRRALVSAMAALEASIDFADEADVDDAVAQRAFAPLEDLTLELEQALSEEKAWRGVREGFRIALLGAPNAGKSSLLNRLAGREAAIVSDIPGTTRDVLDVRLVIAGHVVWLSDTAGLREAADRIEAEGVRRALARAEDADLRMIVVDALTIDEDLAEAGVALARPGDIIVVNKTESLADAVALAPPDGVTRLDVSALTGSGVDALLAVLGETVSQRLSGTQSPLVVRARHRELVSGALGHVHRARTAAHNGLGAELVSEELRLAARVLGRVTGVVDVEDLLDEVFSSFCIGK